MHCVRCPAFTSAPPTRVLLARSAVRAKRSAFAHVQVSVTRLGHGHKRYEQHGFKPR